LKAKVNFLFPEGYLEGADAGQVEDLIGQVLAFDTGNNAGDQQQGQAQDNQGQQQTQQSPDGPSQSSATVQLGQSPDQVVAILGQPVRITDPGGPVKVYQYKGIIIIFSYNKVTKTFPLPQPRQAQLPAAPNAPAAAAQPAAPPQPPATVQLGMSPDQVVAILGQPNKIIDLGGKKIFVYKDIKVTFVNGKVTDAE
jgi:outer membrane protein assembly factor BamE (lipoprotein component of BamABCDE complex)